MWIPYGGVETLVTVQAENLGTVIEPEPEKSSGELERYADLLKDSRQLYVCDDTPATVDLLRDVVGLSAVGEANKFLATDPKRIEAAIPDLKGRFVQLPKVGHESGGHLSPVPPLTEEGKKLFLGTARPDPLFGIIDAKVQAALNWVSGALTDAASARKDFEPTPYDKTPAFERAQGTFGAVRDSKFLTIIPRGGKVRAVLEDAPFDAMKNGFLDASLTQTRGLIVGAGGKGYDDTFSSGLRAVWNAIAAVRRSGEILLVSECGGGMGSPALDLYVSGRITGEGGRREKYVPGLEEVYYLSKLKEEYDVLLLSGIPEIFAKSKLGLTTARGSGEAVGRLLNKLGRTAKLNLVTRAAECRIRSA